MSNTSYDLNPLSFIFFFNDTATTEIYTLSLHDALPIWRQHLPLRHLSTDPRCDQARGPGRSDRKSTRLNSSHGYISYAVFCLKKKKHPPELSLGRRRRSAPSPPSIVRSCPSCAA